MQAAHRRVVTLRTTEKDGRTLDVAVYLDMNYLAILAGELIDRDLGGWRLGELVAVAITPAPTGEPT